MAELSGLGDDRPVQGLPCPVPRHDGGLHLLAVVVMAEGGGDDFLVAEPSQHD